MDFAAGAPPRFPLVQEVPGVCEALGLPVRRMGPRMLADLFEAFAQLADDQPGKVVAFTARKLRDVFNHEGDHEEQERREAREKLHELLHPSGDGDGVPEAVTG